MDDSEEADGRELGLFLQSIRDSRDETRRHGLVQPDEVERSAEDAIANGLRQRELDRTSGQNAKRS